MYVTERESVCERYLHKSNSVFLLIFIHLFFPSICLLFSFSFSPLFPLFQFDIYIKQTLSAISGRRPTDQMMDAVRKLSDDPSNAVVRQNTSFSISFSTSFLLSLTLSKIYFNLSFFCFIFFSFTFIFCFYDPSNAVVREEEGKHYTLPLSHQYFCPLHIYIFTYYA